MPQSKPDNDLKIVLATIFPIRFIDDYEVVQFVHTQVKNQEGLFLCYTKSLTSHVIKLKNSKQQYNIKVVLLSPY